MTSYLFNAQLLSLPGRMALVLPAEAREMASIWRWLEDVVADPANPIHELHVVDVRESMRNGGGPACLRLRIALSEEALAAVDPRFLLDERRLDALEALVERHWPSRLVPADLVEPDCWAAARAARRALLGLLGIAPAELGEA